MSIVAVAVFGTGPVADRLVAGVDRRPDLRSTGRTTSAPAVPEGTACVLYVPTLAEIATDAPKDVVPRLLRDGYDVVSALPPGADLPVTDLREACRAGDSTFHATGGFQTAIATRILRSLSEVTTDIRRIELEEELELPAAGVYPWNTLGDIGIGGTEVAARSAVAAVADYYEAGLHALEDAVFAGAGDPEARPVVTVEVRVDDAGTVEKVTVDRALGPRIGYRSTWSARTTDDPPLRYRLVTSTDTAKGATTLRFDAGQGVHPADHLTCVGLLDAVRPIHDSAQGIAHRDLSITYLMPDERLITRPR
ncbi:hypothetical protein [Nocardia aurea]|uniref:Dihydrodipicolinate reductase n=1 Tax=Nocardia aurea TaxID=2144174 RepID=A0ABV3FVU8_9NOCA